MHEFTPKWPLSQQLEKSIQSNLPISMLNPHHHQHVYSWKVQYQCCSAMSYQTSVATGHLLATFSGWTYVQLGFWRPPFRVLVTPSTRPFTHFNSTSRIWWGKLWCTCSSGFWVNVVPAPFSSIATLPLVELVHQPCEASFPWQLLKWSFPLSTLWLSTKNLCLPGC